MTTPTSPRAAAVQAILAKLARVLLELLPYAMLGVGAGLVFLPAGFMVPGFLWWVADRLDGRADGPAVQAQPSTGQHEERADVHA